MEEPLFSISCTTCQARLTVRNESAVGAILTCPKCGSMVQVVPPPDWQPDAEQGGQPAEAAPGDSHVETPAQPVDEPAETVRNSVPLLRQKQCRENFGENTASGEAVAHRCEKYGLTPAAAGWVSPAELLWRKWLLLAGGSIATVVVVTGVVSVLISRRKPQPAVPTAVEAPAAPTAAVKPAPVETPPDQTAESVLRRWLPDETQMIFSLRLSKLTNQPAANRLIGAAGEAWGQSVGALLRGLGLKRDGISRIMWASTDLASWPEKAVVVIQLSEGHDARALQAVGEPVDLRLDTVPCRCLPKSVWLHPFAVIDRQTIVTGQAELLRLLADRTGPKKGPGLICRNGPEGASHKLNLVPFSAIDRLWKTVVPGADVAVLIDLSAARGAGWRLPGSLLDVWPAGRQAWRLVWEVPRGLGLRLEVDDAVRGKLGLVCEGKTAAEEVRAALDQLVPAAKNALKTQEKTLTARLQSGRLTAAVAGQYEVLLGRGLAALRNAQWEVAEETVWIRAALDTGPSVLALAALDSRPAIQTDWLAAARGADEANQRRLLSGLGGYCRAEGYFPAGAVGGALLPPETRLSWIATMLPYYGHADWHRRLQFGYTWNGRQNRPVTRRPLAEVVNPALGPGRTDAGFPVTHYVGVAGVGPDAGRLKVDHPRAGVFGFGRKTRLKDIVDGAGNTIAVLGVKSRLGAWAAGGAPTVRALTKPPYVNGPDGFGSGQPDGMLAGMADGSVRFISKNVDSRVLEQLATINGGENISEAVAALGPRASPPPRISHQPGTSRNSVPLLRQKQCRENSGKNTASGEAVAHRGEKCGLPHPETDVAARLAQRIPAIELRDRPLGEAVEFLAALGNLPITFDPDTMAELGVGLNDPVSVRLSDATVGEILRKVLAGRGLDYVIESGQVLVTGPENRRAQLRRVRYTVSDLTDGRPAALAQLAALVEKLVAPDSWSSAGGRGSIRPEADALIVTQTAPVHHQVLVFCEKLRVARGESPRSRLDPKRFELSSRSLRARAKLQQPVTVNFHDPTPLVEITSHLAALGGTNILIDRLSLAATRIDPQAACTLTVEKQPLSAALVKLLGPLGLTYRAIDADTLEVTTRKAAADQLEIEFYRVDKLLSKDPTAAILLERIKARVAASTWNDAGGPGVPHFDKPAGCLIVLQSQAVQAELQRLLSTWQTEQKRLSDAKP